MPEMEDHDSRAAANGEQIYVKFPRSISLPFTTLSFTLFYCFFYHHTLTIKDKEGSPEHLREVFKISERRYVRTKMLARAKAGDWTAVRDMVASKKSGIFTKSPKSVIGFEPYCDVVYSNNGPTDLLRYFIGLIEDESRRYSVSLRCKCYDAAISAIASMKEKERPEKISHLKNTLVEQLGAYASSSYREQLDKLVK